MSESTPPEIRFFDAMKRLLDEAQKDPKDNRPLLEPQSGSPAAAFAMLEAAEAFTEAVKARPGHHPVDWGFLTTNMMFMLIGRDARALLMVRCAGFCARTDGAHVQVYEKL